MFQNLFFKILRKLRLNSILYILLKRFIVKDTGNNSFDTDEAYKHLSNIYTPKQSSTCICENVIGYEYDLHFIIPVYNVENYIIQCIESILHQQTHFTYCITIINDGSTDNSRNLLKRYEYVKNVKIIDQNNKGLSGARNTGLRDIKGRYVSFVDSDDYITPNFVELLLSKGLSEDADIVEGSYKTFSNKKKNISTFQHKCRITNHWNKNLFGFAWGKIFKSTLFKNVHFPEGFWFEDTLCPIIIYPQASKIITSSHIVYNYRINKKGITSTSKGNIKSLDSFWITYQLFNDKAILGMENDQQEYEFFLRQIKINYIRIRELNNPVLNKLLFILSCKLLDEYFSTFKTNDQTYIDLERSLKRKNYKAYQLYLFFN